MLSENWCISINTDEFLNRRKRFKKTAIMHSWRVNFWDAVDCRNLQLEQYPFWVSKDRFDYNPERQNTASGFFSNKILSPGEVGIWWSTKKLYEHAIKAKLDWLFVFEDDAMIVKPNDIELQPDVDFIFFNSRNFHDSNNNLLTQHGMEGYVISKQGIEKMLEVCSKTAGVDMPIDLFIGSQCKTVVMNRGLNAFRENKPEFICKHIEKHTAVDKMFPSTIQGSIGEKQ